MTMFNDSAGHEVPPRVMRPSIRSPHANALAWVTGLAWLATLCLAIWGTTIDPDGIFGIDADELVLKSAVSAWADIMLLVAVSTTVGLIILSGVRYMLEQLAHTRR